MCLTKYFMSFAWSSPPLLYLWTCARSKIKEQLTVGCLYHRVCIKLAFLKAKRWRYIYWLLDVLRLEGSFPKQIVVVVLVQIWISAVLDKKNKNRNIMNWWKNYKKYIGVLEEAIEHLYQYKMEWKWWCNYYIFTDR